MKRWLKWTLALVGGAALVVVLVFAFQAGRKEITQEREREKPIKTPARISRDANGNVIVTLDRETQGRIGLKTEPAAAETVYPEIAAYGRLQEDPGGAFVVRAPVAGVLRRADSANWPALGESLAEGARFGAVEPRLAPFEHVDLDTRITNATADVEANQATLDAAKSAYDRARNLNADNKIVSDRAVEEAEAVVKASEAKLAGARKNVAQLESAAKAQAGGAGPIELIGRAGEVVEILARSGESVESGQAILRVARFDSMLARVDVPAGEVLDQRISSARIAPVGHEEQQVRGERVSLASTVDPKTLGEGFVFRVAGLDAMLRPGAAVTAYLQVPGKASRGVLIPYTAVVRFGGKAWTYRQVADDKFSRQELVLDRSNSRGWLITQGIAAGDRIVTAGAQILLSEEQKSQIQVLEEAEGQ
ncbi:MAG TPA: HlyD family efflux transporter periplasmic adaptor subunit [Terriglobales bacterium]|nr:HlyD family efflux transporter periplasmic adaptor subunit [Terriglobales bacterium]HYL65471.1 HlyD family efflux transporter periplasmic adaptor subunit [Candidatus Methylomirabilis sp.]